MTEFQLTFTVWASCSLLYSGWVFAFLQGFNPRKSKLDRKRDMIFSILTSLGGPFSLCFFVVVIGDFKNGWRLW